MATIGIDQTILIAFVGLLGVLIGGLIQTLTQRWVVRYDRMLALREASSEFTEAVSSYASILVQTAMMIDGVRDDVLQRLESEPQAEVDVDEDYLHRLGEGFFGTFTTAQKLGLKLMMSSDYRISDQAGDIHLKIVDIQNEVGLMFTGGIHVPAARAKELQSEIIEMTNVLMNMVTPTRHEFFWNFRSKKSASRRLSKYRKKQAKQA